MAFIDVESLSGKQVIEGYVGRAIHTGTITLMYWTVEAGAIMPTHSHLHQQIANVLKGSFELTVDGETQLLQPGMVAVIPPHIPHGGRAVTPCELLDVFQPEREDYKF